MIEVVVVDDQEVVRAGLRTMLEADAGIRVVGEAADGADGLRTIRSLRPHVALVDIRMPLVDGIALTRQLVAAGDVPTAVLVLTTFGDDEEVVAAFRAGAGGFVLKDAPRSQLVDSVRAVARGEVPLAPTVARRVLGAWTGRPGALGPPSVVAELTSREREVLDLLIVGLSNREIGQRLHLGESTVKTYVGQVLSTLGLRDRVQAVVWAYESGYAQPGACSGPG